MSKYTQHYKELLKLGLPIVVGQLGLIILGFADTLMIGHHSTEELAAASFVNNMFNLIIIFSSGFSYGLTPLVGNLFGQGKKKEVGGLLKNSLFANTVLAILVTAVMTILYLFIDKLGQPVELLGYMRPYYLVLLVSLPFIQWFNAFKQFADCIMETRTSMWILVGGNVFNILGNWVLIYGYLGFPELGLLGAGIATLSSRILMPLMFFCIIFSKKRYAIYKEGFMQSLLNKVQFVQLNKLGWPIAMQMGMETASFSLTAIMVGWLGAIALASHQVMLTIGQLGFMMYYGMAAAMAVRISHFHGQKDYKSIQLSSAAGFHIILLMSMAVSALILTFRNELGNWFTDNGEVTLMVAQIAIPFVIYQFGDGLQCAYSNALRGMADVKSSMVIAFIAYFLISLPSGYLFGFTFDWGLTGIWMSFPLGLTSAGLMYYLRFRFMVKRKA